MKKNKRALITGASSGIGKAYAQHLAALGYDLLLIARREEVLAGVARKIEEDHPVRAEILSADLAVPEGLRRVEEIIGAGTKPDVLIHAAGFGTRGFLWEIDPALLERQVYLMTVAAASLTRMVLPAMVERKEGVVILVSSVAAYVPTAQYTTYAAVKNFLNTFITGLRDELAATDVKVQAVCPGLTRTGFMSTDQYKDFDYSFIPDRFWMDPEEVVEESWLRLTKKYKPVVVTGRKNKLLVMLLNSPLLGPLFRRRISRRVRKRIRQGLPTKF